eukprot:TRINITY_DN118_c0_g1_i1.p1 TRINITY_DN118_c0_g1~~TRINITY_DN118_c0_g1_i1.p1  ORF type:complete len:788 (+),score=182.17 TRINITY_DN118_c0_g1_i1:401-2764(+)
MAGATLVFTFILLTSLLSLSKASIPLTVLFRMCTPAVTYFAEWLCGMQKKSVTRQKKIVLGAMICGAVFTAYLEANWNIEGVFWSVMNTLIVAFLCVFEGITTRMFPDLAGETKAALRNLLSTPFLFLGALATGESPSLLLYYLSTAMSSQPAILIAISCVLAFTIGSGVFHLHEYVSPSFVAVCNCVYKLLTVAVGSLIWANSFHSPLSWLGLGIASVASFYYVWLDIPRDHSMFKFDKEKEHTGTKKVYAFVVVVLLASSTSIYMAGSNPYHIEPPLPVRPYTPPNAGPNVLYSSDTSSSHVLRPFGVNLVQIGHEKGNKLDYATGLRTILEESGIPFQVVNGHDISTRDDAPYFFTIETLAPSEKGKYFRRKPKSFFDGTYHIGVWNMIQTVPPKWFLEYMDFYSEIWATSSYGRDIMSMRSFLPVVSVDIPPMRADKARQSVNVHRLRKQLGLFPETFVFGVVLDLNQDDERTWESAIDAFCYAFDAKKENDVAFVFLVLNMRVNLLRYRSLQASVVDRRVHFFVPERDEEVISMLALSDTLILADHVAYGDLFAAEAMAFGKPVIAVPPSSKIDICKKSCYVVAEDSERGDIRRGLTTAMIELARNEDIYNHFSSLSMKESQEFGLRRPELTVFHRLSRIYREEFLRTYHYPSSWPPVGRDEILAYKERQGAESFDVKMYLQRNHDIRAFVEARAIRDVWNSFLHDVSQYYVRDHAFKVQGKREWYRDIVDNLLQKGWTWDNTFYRKYSLHGGISSAEATFSHFNRKGYASVPIVAMIPPAM